MKVSAPLVIVAGGAALLFLNRGRSLGVRPGATQGTRQPIPTRTSSYYARPGQPGVAVNPLQAILGGVQSIFGITGTVDRAITPSAPPGSPGSSIFSSVGNFFRTANVDATGNATGAAGSSAEILRPVDMNGLYVFPPEIGLGSLSGVTNNPGDPGQFFGAETILYDNAPALDALSGYDTQAGSFVFT